MLNNASQRLNALFNLQFVICILRSAVCSCSCILILAGIQFVGVTGTAQSQTNAESPKSNKNNNDQPNGAGQGGAELDERLKRELGAAAEKEDKNPLVNIAGDMLKVCGRLSQADSSQALLSLQKQIVDDLDDLIKNTENSGSQGAARDSGKQDSNAGNQPPPQALPKDADNSGSSMPPSSADAANQSGGKTTNNSPASKTNEQTNKPDPQKMRSVIKAYWGELPPEARGQMLQAPVEDFVPKYENLIEDYYRRLADEKNEKKN